MNVTPTVTAVEQPVLGSSWTHRLARLAVRPLLGTGVRPNHLTAIRLATGLAACGLFALGTQPGNLWGGVLWLVSAFTDRADGELARIGNMMSARGHMLDYWADNTVSALFFVAIGIGARHSWLGGAAIPLGLLAGGALLACNLVSEALEKRRGGGFRAYAGAGGFDPDDALYLMAPFAWFGILPLVLLLAAIGASTVAAITAIRLRRA